MSVADLISDMVRAGVDPDLIGRTAQLLCEREPVTTVDETAERRRAADRERKRSERLRNSAESADSADTKERSPTPPKEKTNNINILNAHTREAVEDVSRDTPPRKPKRTPRDALCEVLDAEHAGHVIDHRNKLRKPLTVRAAELLARQLALARDGPNEAADRMIARGWQGYNPQWDEEHDKRTSQERTDDAIMQGFLAAS